MSDMKCPICNDGKIITYLDGTYECNNPECSIYNGTHTETFEALIRTRKALDVAMDGLKRIEKFTEPSYKNRNLEALALAVNTFSGEIIEQINQKE